MISGLLLQIFNESEENPIVLDYNPDESAIQLRDPELPEVPIEPAFTKDGVLEVKQVQEAVDACSEIVVNQARQACSCSKETKKLAAEVTSIHYKDESEFCLPCQARGAINAFLRVAQEG